MNQAMHVLDTRVKPVIQEFLGIDPGEMIPEMTIGTVKGKITLIFPHQPSANSDWRALYLMLRHRAGQWGYGTAFKKIEGKPPRTQLDIRIPE